MKLRTIKKVTSMFSAAVMLIAMASGCGGGGGTPTANNLVNTKPGIGRVSYTVEFPGRADAAKVLAAAPGYVDVTVSITGYYEDDGTLFEPVSASKEINVSTGSGYGTVSVLDVPIGKNHMLVATAKWSDGVTQIVKAIVPSVTEGHSSSVSANLQSTAVADAAVGYASAKDIRLPDITSSQMTEIEAAVAHYYLENKSYTGLTSSYVVAYLTPATITVTPTTASVYDGSTQQFTGAVKNSQGITVVAEGTWSVTGGIGTITTAGLFTATTAGTGTVVYTSGTITGSAAVTVLSSALTITITPTSATAIVAGTQQFSAVITNSQNDTVTGQGTWSVSGGIGTITTAGLFTATTAGVGAVVYTYETYTGSATVTVTAATAADACSTAALQGVSSAKTLLFQPTVTETAFNSAKAYVDAALIDSPTCPDALLLSAIGDMATEGERVSTTLTTDGASIFPMDNGYVLSGTVGRVIMPVTGNLPRVSNVVTTTFNEYSNASEYQAEIINNSLGVLEGALAKLEAARTIIAADSTWTFSIPKDTANLSLGNDTLDKFDVDILTGTLKLLVGYVYYALAYNLDVPSGYVNSDPCPEMSYSYTFTGPVVATDTTYIGLAAFNECVDADLNNDNILTPTEYVLPSPYGTLNTNGATYLANFASYVSSSFMILDAAVDGILLESSATLGSQTITTSLLEDVNYYKHYLSELAASFGGTATIIPLPAKADCWKSSTFTLARVSNQITEYYYVDHSIDDLDNNPDEAVGCATVIETEPAKNLLLNLGALAAVTDIRDILPTYDVVSYDEIFFNTTYTNTELYFNSSYKNSTLGGLMPNGIQAGDFDYKEAMINLTIRNIIDSTTGINIAGVPTTGITLNDGTNTVTSDYSYGGGSNGFMMAFSPTSLPTEADYLKFSDLFGYQYTLTIPGYQPVSITLFDSHGHVESVTVTPTTL